MAKVIIVQRMAGPSDLLVRQPAWAGKFYPADAGQCRALARSYTDVSIAEESTRLTGGIVPHAGWICSGAIAGLTLAALAAGGQPDVVVVFGAIHTPLIAEMSMLDSYARWDLPGEACEVSTDLRRRVLERGSLFRVDDRFHRTEHAVEVELPLIRSVWPNAGVLPIEVPMDDRASEVGRAVAQAVNRASCRAVFLASSDLTHYGPAYRFAPAGVGIEALQWAKNNDRQLIDKVLRMQDQSIVPEVRARHSACGAGAIAAMIAACKELGASRATLLRHASSFETLAQVAPQPPDNAVGYASIVIG
jgi:AmmeMemoRadiSam system protein B